MHENDISEIIRDCCFKIHRNLGPGLLESVYEKILIYEISQYNLSVERQKSIALTYGDITLQTGFRADVIVEEKLILEIKSIETLLPVHSKQLLTYLKISNLKLGLLINFNIRLMKDGIIRIVNNL
jgi:GxxExxY protein